MFVDFIIKGSAVIDFSNYFFNCFVIASCHGLHKSPVGTILFTFCIYQSLGDVRLNGEEKHRVKNKYISNNNILKR